MFSRFPAKLPIMRAQMAPMSPAATVFSYKTGQYKIYTENRLFDRKGFMHADLCIYNHSHETFMLLQGSGTKDDNRYHAELFHASSYLKSMGVGKV